MGYRIVVDSCTDLEEAMKKDEHIVSVPLQLIVDEYTIIDDETFDQADFLKKVKESPNCPKSACPSPEKYMESYTCDEEDIYVVTLSDKLSGSYNSAVLGKNLYHEEKGEKNIHVFNSKSASAGQTIIAMKIKECAESGMSFEKTVECVEGYIESMDTYFVLETLDTLRKNGRLTGVKAIVAGALNIKPVMGSTDEGSIQQLGQARGMNKALMKMIECAVGNLGDQKNLVLGISHCNCPERALHLKEEFEKYDCFKEIHIFETAGVSSLYAGDGGIVIAV